jgi:NAD(P)-dependent dehydrogenase (short-subunit alcohol dehydrogenase family)
MELRFDGRVALVTGSSQGTGRAYAELLAARGAKVVINSRTPDALEEVAAGIRAKGGEVAIAAGDLTDQQACRDAVAMTVKTFGRIDILINNAGVSKRKNFEEITAEEFDEIVALNLNSTFYMVQAAFPHMKAAGYGRIVNTGSGTGMFGTKNNVHYGSSKAGVYGLMRTFAIDAEPFGIKINTVTPMAATRLANNIQDEEFKRLFFATLPPERCAPIVCYLSHESCSVSDEVFDIGGGVVSRIFTGLTKGYVNPDMTIEDVAANIGQIMDETNYTTPRDAEKRGMEVIGLVREWNRVHGR